MINNNNNYDNNNNKSNNNNNNNSDSDSDNDNKDNDNDNDNDNNKAISELGVNKSLITEPIGLSYPPALGGEGNLPLPFPEMLQQLPPSDQSTFTKSAFIIVHF